MNVAFDIGAILAAAGLVTLSPAPNFTWFERFMPDTPDDVTVIFEYEGQPPRRTHDDFGAIDRPRFQIVTRGVPGNDAAAKARADSIRAALDGIVDTELASGARAIVIRSLGFFGFLKRDQLSRAHFAANYEAEVAS